MPKPEKKSTTKNPNLNQVKTPTPNPELSRSETSGSSKKPAKSPAPTGATSLAKAAAAAPVAVPSSRMEATPAKAAPMAPKPDPTVKAVLAFYAPWASHVSLCGEFNAWSPEAAPMKRLEDGRWEAEVALPPGRYQYKFVADGQWMADPNAPETVPNSLGTENSVIELRN